MEDGSVFVSSDGDLSTDIGDSTMLDDDTDAVLSPRIDGADVLDGAIGETKNDGDTAGSMTVEMEETDSDLSTDLVAEAERRVSEDKKDKHRSARAEAEAAAVEQLAAEAKRHEEIDAGASMIGCIQCGTDTSIDEIHPMWLNRSITSLVHAKTDSVVVGVLFAHAVFRQADKNGDGSLSKTEIRKYFKTHPIEKSHILGPDFTWKAFFTSMDKDGDSHFDIEEFTEAVSQVYHEHSMAEAGEEDVLREALRQRAYECGVRCPECHGICLHMALRIQCAYRTRAARVEVSTLRDARAAKTKADQKEARVAAEVAVAAAAAAAEEAKRREEQEIAERKAEEERAAREAQQQDELAQARAAAEQRKIAVAEAELEAESKRAATKAAKNAKKRARKKEKAAEVKRIEEETAAKPPPVVSLPLVQESNAVANSGWDEEVEGEGHMNYTGFGYAQGEKPEEILKAERLEAVKEAKAEADNRARMEQQMERQHTRMRAAKDLVIAKKKAAKNAKKKARKKEKAAAEKAEKAEKENEEARRVAEEELRVAEETRLAAERETARLAEESRLAEEARLTAEREEAALAHEEKLRQAEEVRLAAEREAALLDAKAAEAAEVAEAEAALRKFKVLLSQNTQDLLGYTDHEHAMEILDHLEVSTTETDEKTGLVRLFFADTKHRDDAIAWIKETSVAAEETRAKEEQKDKANDDSGEGELASEFTEFEVSYPRRMGKDKKVIGVDPNRGAWVVRPATKHASVVLMHPSERWTVDEGQPDKSEDLVNVCSAVTNMVPAKKGATLVVEITGPKGVKQRKMTFESKAERDRFVGCMTTGAKQERLAEEKRAVRAAKEAARAVAVAQRQKNKEAKMKAKAEAKAKTVDIHLVLSEETQQVRNMRERVCVREKRAWMGGRGGRERNTFRVLLFMFKGLHANASHLIRFCFPISYVSFANRPSAWATQTTPERC